MNLAVGSGLYALSGRPPGATYAVCVTIGYVAGMGVNFSLNRLFTFERDRRGSLSQLRTFFVVALFGLVLNVVLASASKAGLELFFGTGPLVPAVRFSDPATLSQAAAIGVVSIYSFFAHKYLTFAGGIRARLFRARGRAETTTDPLGTRPR